VFTIQYEIYKHRKQTHKVYIYISVQHVWLKEKETAPYQSSCTLVTEEWDDKEFLLHWPQFSRLWPWTGVGQQCPALHEIGAEHAATFLQCREWSGEKSGERQKEKQQGHKRGRKTQDRESSEWHWRLAGVNKLLDTEEASDLEFGKRRTK
jgi:hypothetical protein